MTRRFDDRRGLGPRGDEKRLLPKRLRRDDQLRLQDQASQALGCFADIDATYRQMAERLQDFNVLSYLSSHDTRLFFAGDARLAAAATAGGEPAVAGAGCGADLLRR